MIFPNLFHAQLNPLLPVVPAAAAAVVFAPLAWLAMSRPGVASPWAMALTLVGCAAGYGYGAVAVVDIQFDSSAGTVFSAPVLGKYAYHGKSSSYHLNLPPWGPRTRADSVEVSSVTYDALKVGEHGLHHPASGGLEFGLVQRRGLHATGALDLIVDLQT